MTELSPAARALIDAARDAMAPDANALRRVRGKVDAAVGGAVGGALAVKLMIVVGIAALVGGAIATRDRDQASAPQLLFSTTTANETSVERVHVEAPPPTTHIEMPTQRASRAVLPTNDLPAPTVAKADVVESSIGLAREVQLLDAAMDALRKGEANVALASVRIHREETRGHGQLAEDAAAIEIEALCRLHDRRVVAKLEAFDARWPESAQRSRLSTSCP